jgi:hypothetical protein
MTQWTAMNLRRRTRRLVGHEGFDFVRCRICAARRRVISGKHLSMHDIARESYMKEFRLSPHELIAKDFRALQSSRKGYHPYGKREWIAEFKRVYKIESHVSTRYLQHNYPLIYEQGIWIVGDWDKALCAAGFDPKRMRMRKVWGKENIIKAIRRSLPLYAHYTMTNHNSLFCGAQREFGSWNQALIAAGVPKKQVSGMLRNNRTRILPALRDALDDPSACIPEALKFQAVHYFGSLRKAIIAAKNDLEGWSKERITSILSKMYRSKTLPPYARARREYPRLVSAAEPYFGSWGKALHAVGIGPI